jgi:hypothetical protein
VDEAVRVFFLDRGALPPDLGTLAHLGYLRESDLVDAWNRPFALAISADGYRIVATDENGEPVLGLSLTHRFTPVERMMLAPRGSERAAAKVSSVGS